MVRLAVVYMIMVGFAVEFVTLLKCSGSVCLTILAVHYKINFVYMEKDVIYLYLIKRHDQIHFFKIKFNEQIVTFYCFRFVVCW